ncbi:MAG: hypothetical protein JST54_20720 [Deltaproteobacteria bacterium]|nr:hypothetical protein [Deltaproteobacteria bacterium]
MLHLRASDGGIDVGGAFVVNPRSPVARAVVTHASRIRDALSAAELVVPAPLAFALPDGHAARIVEPDSTFTLGGLELQFDPLLQLHIAGTTIVTGAPAKASRPCEQLVLDATYGLPIFRWSARDELVDALRIWRQLNIDAGRPMLLCAEPTDEALQLIDLLGDVFAHPEIVALARRTGRRVELLPARGATKAAAGKVILAPPSELDAPALPKLTGHEKALASGRMRVRGNRRRLAIHRGFTLSSRADWPALLSAIDAHRDAQLVLTGAHASTLTRFLATRGMTASVLS